MASFQCVKSDWLLCGYVLDTGVCEVQLRECGIKMLISSFNKQDCGFDWQHKHSGWWQVRPGTLSTGLV